MKAARIIVLVMTDQNKKALFKKMLNTAIHL